LNAKLIGEAEDWIVLVKLAILVLFIAVGIWGIDGARLANDTHSKRWLSIIGVGLCLSALGSLLWQSASNFPGYL